MNKLAYIRGYMEKVGWQVKSPSGIREPSKELPPVHRASEKDMDEFLDRYKNRHTAATPVKSNVASFDTNIFQGIVPEIHDPARWSGDIPGKTPYRINNHQVLTTELGSSKAAHAWENAARAHRQKYPNHFKNWYIENQERTPIELHLNLKRFAANNRALGGAAFFEHGEGNELNRIILDRLPTKYLPHESAHQLNSPDEELYPKDRSFELLQKNIIFPHYGVRYSREHEETAPVVREVRLGLSRLGYDTSTRENAIIALNNFIASPPKNKTINPSLRRLREHMQRVLKASPEDYRNTLLSFGDYAPGISNIQYNSATNNV